MAFNSLLFITKFLPIILVLYFIVPKKYKNIILLVSSLFLYTWANPKYLLLLLVLLIVNYFLSMLLYKQQELSRKKVLIEVLVINVLVLGYFKYYEPMLSTIFTVVPIDITFQEIIVPLGLSFIIFQLIGYQIDIYKRKIKPVRNIVSYGLTFTFFPKVLMGPIVDMQEWLPQISKHPFNSSLFNIGAKRFIIGLGQKVILAGTFGAIWTSIQQSEISMFTAWLGIVVFAFEIYFDFCGYSHMAIGLSNILGFTMMENFNYPYCSRSVVEFWKRWHISLGRWFKEYLYIPLGGNRVSVKRHIINIFIIWLVTGIWHGGKLTFIVWGLYFGIIIVIEKYYLYKKRANWSKLRNLALTLLLVNIGWVFFASDDIVSAVTYLGKLVNINTIEVIDYTTLWIIRNYWVYFIIAIVASLPIASNLTKSLALRYPKMMSVVINLGLLIVFVVSIAFMISSSYQPFMYANF